MAAPFEIRPWMTVAVACLVTATVPAGSSQDVPTFSGAPWGAWRVETADAAGIDGYPSIALDSSGNPHIAYDDGDFTAMKYARRDGLGWVTERLFQAEWAAVPEIAVDESNVVHLAYLAAFQSDVKYAVQDGATWDTEVVDSSSGTPKALRIDGQGSVHLGYSKGNNDLAYAKRGASGWTLEVVDTDATAFWSGMDLDPEGVPHFAYDAPGGAWGRLKYATKASGGGWVTSTVDTQGGTDATIAVDSQGRPHVAYRGAGETLKYAVLDDGEWHLEVVDALNIPTGWYGSIDTDSQNRPHIAYHYFNRGNFDDPTSNHLKYATRLASGQWVFEYVDIVGQNGLDTDIVLDASDRPRIAYKLSGQQIPGLPGAQDLRYAEPGTAFAAHVSQT